MVWGPQRQQGLRVVIIVVIIIVVVVVVVVVERNNLKRIKWLVTPASGSPEVDQGLITRS